MKVVWSSLAIERAIEEARFIAEDKPGAADRWLDGLFKTVDRLEVFPDSGHGVPELPNTRYRQLTHRSHRVVFVVDGKSVSVLTVRRFRQRFDTAEVEPHEAG
ncbi:MAG: type II toxin-antitoxin system RelE/ParE family toxin [Thermoanaerobaculia bacterium]|nr:type II toxin-antitoxin system RelE/ParE family toxin [Thermoanaerobaculia bacterium]